MMRIDTCQHCHRSGARFTCDRCSAEIIGADDRSSRPFEVVVNAPEGSQAATHLCGSCAVELAKLGIALLPVPPKA